MQEDDRSNAQRLSDNMKSPLMVAPEYLGKLGIDAMPIQQPEVVDKQTPAVNEPNFTQSTKDGTSQQDQPPKMDKTEIQQANATLDTLPMSPQEKLLAEFKAMQERDQKALDEARSSDRMLKMGGAIGDALATVLNARGQMNVKAPGAGVKEGAGLGKVADMFQTSPEIAADLKRKREDLLAQFKTLKNSGEMTPYQKAYLEMKIRDQELREQSQQGVQGRHEDTLGLKREEKGQLSDKVATSFADMQTAKQEAARLLPRVKEAGLGILGTPYQKGRAAIGLPTKEFQALESDYAGIRNTIRNALFGSALTGPEISAFEKELNDISISQSGFEDNLSNFIDRVDRKMTERAKAMAKAQPLKEKALKQFMAPESNQNTGPYGDTVERNGKTYKWNPAVGKYQPVG
jgi:hypothetical protein